MSATPAPPATAHRSWHGRPSTDHLPGSVIGTSATLADCRRRLRPVRRDGARHGNLGEIGVRRISVRRDRWERRTGPVGCWFRNRWNWRKARRVRADVRRWKALVIPLQRLGPHDDPDVQRMAEMAESLGHSCTPATALVRRSWSPIGASRSDCGRSSTEPAPSRLTNCTERRTRRAWRRQCAHETSCCWPFARSWQITRRNHTPATHPDPQLAACAANLQAQVAERAERHTRAARNRALSRHDERCGHSVNATLSAK